MDLSEAIKELERAARTLSPEQGLVARRNARQRVLQRLRTVKLALGQQYPAMKKERSTPRKRKRRNEAVESKLVREGWKMLDRYSLGQALKVGVKPKIHYGNLYFPPWFVIAMDNPKITLSELKALKASKKLQDALLVRQALLRHSTV